MPDMCDQCAELILIMMLIRLPPTDYGIVLLVACTCCQGVVSILSSTVLFILSSTAGSVLSV